MESGALFLSPLVFMEKHVKVRYLDPATIRAFQDAKLGCKSEDIVRGKRQIGVDRYEQLLGTISPNYTCTLCHQTTVRKGDAQRHLVDVHMKWYKPFKCSHCNHRSSQAQQIKTHELSKHNIGVRKRCAVLECPKSFVDASQLSVHQRTHSKEEMQHVVKNASAKSKAARQSALRRHLTHRPTSSSLTLTPARSTGITPPHSSGDAAAFSSSVSPASFSPISPVSFANVCADGDKAELKMMQDISLGLAADAEPSSPQTEPDLPSSGLFQDLVEEEERRLFLGGSGWR